MLLEGCRDLHEAADLNGRFRTEAQNLANPFQFEIPLTTRRIPRLVMRTAISYQGVMSSSQLPRLRSLRACLKIARGAAARDFGDGRGGEVRASPVRAVRTELTKAFGAKTAPRAIFRHALKKSVASGRASGQSSVGKFL